MKRLRSVRECIISIFPQSTSKVCRSFQRLSAYPRTFEKDCRTLEAVGVELVFAPSAEEMYPPGASTFVEVTGLSARLDGVSRSGHFRGVATVVAKLLNIFAPDHAYFGQKDAAQVAVLRKMVRDLQFPVQLAVCPTVREPDGLAMSSRNQNLSVEERCQALVLWRALLTVQRQVVAGEHDPGKLIAGALRVLGAEPAVQVDYFRIVDPDTLEDVAGAHRGALVAVAARVGGHAADRQLAPLMFPCNEPGCPISRVFCEMWEFHGP
jgi:pantoate--beta-alanine ligase